MNEYRRNILVGAFMLAGLGVAATLMVLFGEHPSWMGGAEYELAIKVADLSGIQEGTPIEMSGVEVGRVDRLEFKDRRRPHTGARIIARIKKDYAIPRDTIAAIYVSPIGLGRSRIRLVPPELPPDASVKMLPQEGAEILGGMANVLEDVIPPTMLSTLERTARQIGDFAAELTPVAQDLHMLLRERPVSEVDEPAAAARRVTANLSTVTERFDLTLKHFNDVLGDPEVQSGLRQAVVNIERMSEDGRETFANLRQTSATFQSDLKRISDEMASAAVDLRSQVNRVGEAVMPVLDNSATLTAHLNRAAIDLAEGNGTAGLLLRDARLYESLLISVERLTDLIDTFRRLAAKFERQGRIDLKVQTVVGPVDKSIPIPE